MLPTVSSLSSSIDSSVEFFQSEDDEAEGMLPGDKEWDFVTLSEDEKNHSTNLKTIWGKGC